MPCITLNIQIESNQDIPSLISIGDRIGKGRITARANYDLFDVLERIEAAADNNDAYEALEEINEIIIKQGSK